MIPASSPGEDVAIARAALRGGNFGHALQHVAGALAVDPLRPEWLALLDEVAGAAGDALALVPAEEGTFFALQAVRARLLHRAGRVAEAVPTLLRASGADPRVPFLAWAVEWLEPDEAVRSLDPDVVAPALRAVLGRLWSEPAPLDAYDPRRVGLRYADAIAVRVRSVHDAHGDLCGAHSQLLRWLGRPADAVAVARRGHELAGTAQSAVLLATALRDDGRPEASLEWLRKAAALDPRNPAIQLDIGDLLLSLDRFAEAASAYAEALRLQAHHPWAEPSLVYALLRDGRPPPGVAARVAKLLGRSPSRLGFDRLRDLARHNERALELLSRLIPAEPYQSRLPGPADASIHLLRGIVSRWNEARAAGTEGERDWARDMQVTVSVPESPSVRVAFALQLELLGIPGTPSFTIQRVPTPDPRLPRRPVRHVLWRFDGLEPRPVPAPPSEAVAGELSRLVEQPFRIERWSSAAAELADRLGADRVPELLGAMVHPPRPRGPHVPAPEWLDRIQIASALVIARLPGPWPDSVRREVLLDLLDGPQDWTIGAAAIALADVATRNAAARAEVESAFRARLRERPAEGHYGWDYPLVCAYQRLPGLAPGTARELAELRARIGE